MSGMSIKGQNMSNCRIAIGIVCVGLLSGDIGAQQDSSVAQTQMQYIGKSVRGVPVSPAVKMGKALFVSGTPGFDRSGKLAVGDFSAQMKQVMENITDILKSSGIGWERVAKVNIYLTRREDFGEMNRIYSTYFPSGNYPARTTLIVSALPQADFLLEIECEALLE
jgi:2-iminobutanoate/2-iminopropanoate deaminase